MLHESLSCRITARIYICLFSPPDFSWMRSSRLNDTVTGFELSFSDIIDFWWFHLFTTSVFDIEGHERFFMPHGRRHSQVPSTCILLLHFEYNITFKTMQRFKMSATQLLLLGDFLFTKPTRPNDYFALAYFSLLCRHTRQKARPTRNAARLLRWHLITLNGDDYLLSASPAYRDMPDEITEISRHYDISPL